MSDQSTTQPDIFNILVEQGAGTGNYVSRETYTGTEDDVRQYAQNIANAEGAHVRVTKTTGDEVGVFDPRPQDAGSQ